MLRIIPISILIVSTIGLANAQNERMLIREGNKQYKSEKYEEAEESYRQSMLNGPTLDQGSFNLGDALYQQEEYEEAAAFFESIAQQAAEPEVRAQAFHNLGNTQLKSGKIEESIEAYKNALRLNPKDSDTRYNLVYAQQLLKKQQEEQQQQQDQDQQNQDQEQEDQQDQEQQQQQEGQDDQQENQQQQEQEEGDQEQEQQQPKEGDKGEEEQEAEQQPRPDQLTKEEAERLLEAVKSEEKQIQEEVDKKKIKGKRQKTDKDW
jgi:tetratricopeptide (TPR) repeat protein